MYLWHEPKYEIVLKALHAQYKTKITINSEHVQMLLPVVLQDLWKIHGSLIHRTLTLLSVSLVHQVWQTSQQHPTTQAIRQTFIHSVGMCRIRQFIAVLTTFFHNTNMAILICTQEEKVIFWLCSAAADSQCTMSEADTLDVIIQIKKNLSYNKGTKKL